MSKQVVFPEIAASMARNGESQKDLATALGLSVSQLSRRLSGLVEWKDSEIRAICERYGKPYEILFSKDVGVIVVDC